jgi:hypothetical protein
LRVEFNRDIQSSQNTTQQDINCQQIFHQHSEKVYEPNPRRSRRRTSKGSHKSTRQRANRFGANADLSSKSLKSNKSSKSPAARRSSKKSSNKSGSKRRSNTERMLVNANETKIYCTAYQIDRARKAANQGPGPRGRASLSQDRRAEAAVIDCTSQHAVQVASVPLEGASSLPGPCADQAMNLAKVAPQLHHRPSNQSQATNRSKPWKFQNEINMWDHSSEHRKHQDSKQDSVALQQHRQSCPQFLLDSG